MLEKVDVAVIKIVPDGCCTYCHRAFGSCVTWHKRNRYLEEVREHALPRAIGGRIIVPACQICNAVKGALIFESLEEIQNYCLDRLIADNSITVKHAQGIRIERAVRAEDVTAEEVGCFQNSEDENVQVFRLHTAEVQAKRNATLARPEVRARMSASQKEVNSRPGVRAQRAVTARKSAQKRALTKDAFRSIAIFLDRKLCGIKLKKSL